jgi:TldD protein
MLDLISAGMKMRHRQRPCESDIITDPRMTNTFLDNGNHPADIPPVRPKEFISLRRPADTISGQFNFIVGVYLIGRWTLRHFQSHFIGRGIDVLTNIDGVGNDLKLGVGPAARLNGPVTSGQPTVRIASGITVGGSA